MKHFLFYPLVILGLGMCTSILYGQKIDFTIRYQTTDAIYEVYALPDFNEADFFIGGGSQISILLPSVVDNAPLIVTSINGGPWYDNSQVYTPAIANITDFHGIASNGSRIDLVAGKEILLFTFELPEIECIQGIRLFNNPSDPDAQVPSMNGADFKNFFVNVFSLTDYYQENYDNEGTTCSTPTIVIPPISTATDSTTTTCGIILDENKSDVHTVNICDAPKNGSIMVDLNNQTKELCLEFIPDTGFIGMDSVCLEVCDQLGLCRIIIVPIDVYCRTYPTPIIIANDIACPEEQVRLETSNTSNNLTYFWTDGNGQTIGTGLFIEFPSEQLTTLNPIQVNIQDSSCPPTASLPINIELVNFSSFLALNSGPICKGGSATLTASGEADATYFWYVDNELIAVGANSNIQQIEATTTYELVVEYKGCQNPDILQTTVLVQDAPIIGAVPRSLTVCPGTDVSITPINENPQGQEIVYTWKGPNDFTYKNTTKSDSFGVFIPNITSEQSGAYSIDLTTLSGCNVDSRSVFIDVQANREPPILHASITEACLGQAVTLTATVQDDAEVIFEWFFQQDNEAPSLLATTNQTAFLLESIELANAGNYLVRTVKDGCISGFSNTEVIQITPNLTVVESSNNGPICAGESVQLSATEIPNAIYNWYVANTNEIVIAGNNPILTNITATTTFELRVLSNNCQEELISQTTVIVQPKPISSNLAELANYCQGEIAVINAQSASSNGQTLQYIWTGPNEFSFTNTTTVGSFELVIPNITIAQAGTYSLEILTESGCAAVTQSILIDVNDNLEAPMLSTDATAVCQNEAVELHAMVQDDAALTFEWFTQTENGVMEQLATTSHPTFLLGIINTEKEGNYLVRVRKNNCFSGFSNTLPLSLADTITTVASSNNGPICAGESVQLSATEIPNAVYNWYIANTNELVIAGNNPTLTNIEETTTFELRVVGNNCREEIRSQTTVIVQPKPTSSNLSESASYCQGETATINAQSTSNNGQTLQYIWTGPNEFSFTNTTTMGDFELVIPNLTANQAGTYNLEILTENGCAAIVQSILIEINDDLETPMLSTDAAAVCQNEAVALHATIQDDETLTFEWFTQTENEVIEQLATTSHPSFLLGTINAANEGKYLVRTKKNDCFSGFSNTLTISLADTITTVESSNNGPICVGESVQLSATAIPGATYNWYSTTTGTLVATGNQPILDNLKENTTFELRMTGTSCQEMLISQTEVLVNPTLAVINLNPIISVCNGADAVLNVANANPLGEEIQYVWRGPNDFESSAMTTNDSFNLFLPSMTTTQAGTYTLEIESANNCSAFVGTVQVNVITAAAPPQLTVNQELICSGSELILQASISPQTNTTFEWYLQRANEPLFLLDITEIATFSIANPTSANSGDYLVKIINSDCASGFSNPQKVTVLDASQPILATNTSTENTAICAGDFVQLNVPFFEGATYLWFGPGNYQSTQQNPFIDNLTPAMAGDYFAVITIPDCESLFSTATTVFVRPKFTSPTLISNTPLCIGDNITLEVSSFLNFTETDTVNYQWFKAGTDAMLGETTVPQLTIPNATVADAGDYYLLPFVNGCVGDTSILVNVTVNVRPTLIANAGMDKKICAAGRVFLAANTVEFATGKWLSTTGAIFEKVDSAKTIATNLIAGENHFIWSLQNDCNQTAKDTLTISIDEVTTDIALAGADRAICNPTDFELMARPLVTSQGVWSQSEEQAEEDIIIVDPIAANSEVLGLEPDKDYQFTWTISNTNCENYDSATVAIHVNVLPEEIAYIPNANEIQALCEGTVFNLAAEIPLFSMGKWTTTGDAIIVQPSSAETISDELSFGMNQFIWSLSTTDCPDFSADTLLIYKDGLLMANPDNYTIPLNDSLGFNVFENDAISDFENTTFIITKYPDNGTLREETNGIITYIPQTNFFGADNFRYKLCNNFCEESCDTAIVNLVISGIDASSGACFIPNVISPNGDDINDQFLIGCLGEFPDASVKIFNRWGDVVYQAAPYLNDWEGTHNNQPLPAGTYFYQLQLTAESKAIQDFIMIFR